MEDAEPPSVRLGDVCRSCLIKTDDMFNFTSKDDQSSEIIAMLASVGNIEIEINDFLPAYLCKTCEDKLRLSYQFQMLIQRSNEIIKECVNDAMVLAKEEDEDEELEKSRVKGRRSLDEVAAIEVQEVINEYREKLFGDAVCIECGIVTSNMRALSVHMSHLHKDLKDRWCSFCNAFFDDLPQHLHLHSDFFKCKFCNKTFTSSSHFYEHLKAHSNVKPHTCKICKKGFIAERHLEKHLKIHKKSPIEQKQSPRNFCTLCKKRVRSITSHFEQAHSDQAKSEGLLCTHCGKKFSNAWRFRLHMRTHTGETPYKCHYCDRRMTNRNHLVLHERTHTGEKPYVCTICGRGFSQSSVLNTHMKIHTGRPEECAICLKRFCRPAQLRLHMRKHTGEQPYKCTECEQAFKQQSHLSEHLKRHSDLRPYKCLHCDKSFKQMSTLKSHLTIHTGEKPFKCSQCAYACRQRYSLTQHMKQHSADTPNPEKPHICHLCQRGYSTMAMLMSHTDLVHKVATT